MKSPRTASRRSLRTAVVATSLLLSGCQTTTQSEPHLHKHTATVTITDAALLPEPTIHVPAFATVVWRNRSSSPVAIDIDIATCGSCDTVLGFTPTASGARSTTVAPGNIVTLCFHEAGSFAFIAHLGGIEHRGTIEVGGTQ